MEMEAHKKRFIRDLKAKRRHTISSQVIQKYNWTTDELAFLKPYISNHDPSLITNTEDDPKCYSKKDAYDTIDAHVENREVTKKNYRSRVNALLKLMNTGESFSALFVDTNELIKRIIDNYKDPTSYFAFILFMFGKSEKLNNCAPKNTFDLIQKQFNEFKTKKTVQSLKERREDVRYEKIYKTLFDTEAKLSKSKDTYASMKHVIALMYTHALYDKHDIIHINPRNYFISVLLVDNDNDMTDDTTNYYNTKTGRLLLNKYKTSGIYEAYDVILNDYSRKVILDSLSNNPRKFLIERLVEGGLYANNSLSNTIKTLFAGYTINDIRKAIESYEVNVKKTDRIHLAKVSRHTVLTQEVSYLAQ